MKCEARREDPRHSRSHREVAKAREQRQEPEVPGGTAVPAPVTAPAVPSPLWSDSGGQVKHKWGQGKLCHGGVTVDTPGQSRPQVLSGWAPLGEPRGGCEAPANPNPGRKTVRHPQAMLPKEPGASQGSFPARWGQPRARWAELSWQSQSIQDGLPFPNPVCSDRKPKKEGKERTNEEREKRFGGFVPAATAPWG